ncbi:O-antigen ligase family protein [Oleisolibacter albus]|uniref:O-antigen ligase family protein n=1 Tax=Oleisolibacter albus TaxID=2171757 RepID=UPI000DF2E315|nr:O-antigen ligase family protein [Oleisolibacter albus]
MPALPVLCLLLTTGLLPLAFGGVGAAAWSLYAAAIGTLLAVQTVSGAWQRTGRVIPWTSPQLRTLSMLGMGFVLLALWIAAQAIPGLPGIHPVFSLAGDYFRGVGQTGLAQAGTLSVAPDRTAEALIRWLAYGCTFLAAADLARQREQAWRLVQGTALIGLAYAAYGMLMYLAGIPLVLWVEKTGFRDALTSTFINRNSFATYAGLSALCWMSWLLAALPSTAPHLPAPERRLRLIRHLLNRSLPLAVCLMLTLSAVLLTKSRAGIAATLTGMIVLVLADLAARGLTMARALRAGAIILASLAVVAVSADGLATRLRWHGIADPLRSAAADIMIEAVPDSLWTGMGRGAFEPAFSLYRDTRLAAHFDRGHQDYLELLFEIGLPASLLLLGLSVAVAVSCILGLRRRQRDRTLPALGLGTLALVGVHARFDFSLQIPAVAALLMLILGISWSQSYRQPRRRPAGNGG